MSQSRFVLATAVQLSVVQLCMRTGFNLIRRRRIYTNICGTKLIPDSNIYPTILTQKIA